MPPPLSTISLHGHIEVPFVEEGVSHHVVVGNTKLQIEPHTFQPDAPPVLVVSLDDKYYSVGVHPRIQELEEEVVLVAKAGAAKLDKFKAMLDQVEARAKQLASQLHAAQQEVDRLKSLSRTTDSDSSASADSDSATNDQPRVPAFLTTWSDAIPFLTENGFTLPFINMRNRAGQTPILAACAKGNFEIVKLLYSLHSYPLADLRTADKDQDSAVLLAVDSGNLDLVQWLVDQNSETSALLAPTHVNRGGFNAALTAAKKGHLHILQWLKAREETSLISVASSFTTDYKTDLGHDLVLCAAKARSLPCLQWLESIGFSLQSTSIHGANAAILAAADFTLLKFLASRWVPLASLTTFGTSALHYAALYGSLESVKWLLAQNIPITSKKYSVLHFTCMAEIFSAEVFEWFECMAGISPHDVDENGYGCIHWAALSKSKDPKVALSYLQGRGFDMTQRTKTGRTILHLAAAAAPLETVKWLAQVPGLNPNEIDPKTGCNMAHFVCSWKGASQIDVLEWLEQEHGISLQARSKAGHSLLHSAAANAMLPLVRYLMEERGFSVHDMAKPLGRTPFHLAAAGHNYDVAEYMLKRGAADIDALTSANSTALSSAIYLDDIPLMDWLVARGATIPHPALDHPVLTALSKGSLNALKWLAARGISPVGVKDKENRTPIHLAAILKHTHVLDWLHKEQGLALDVHDGNGSAPIHIVAASGPDGIPGLQWLLDHGVSPDSKTKNGHTARALASTEAKALLQTWKPPASGAGS